MFFKEIFFFPSFRIPYTIPHYNGTGNRGLFGLNEPCPLSFLLCDSCLNWRLRCIIGAVEPSPNNLARPRVWRSGTVAVLFAVAAVAIIVTVIVASVHPIKNGPVNNSTTVKTINTTVIPTLQYYTDFTAIITNISGQGLTVEKSTGSAGETAKKTYQVATTETTAMKDVSVSPVLATTITLADLRVGDTVQIYGPAKMNLHSLSAFTATSLYRLSSTK